MMFDFHFIVHDNYEVIMHISEQSLYVRNVILNATGWEVELAARFQDCKGFIPMERVKVWALSWVW